MRPACRCARIERWRRANQPKSNSITGQTTTGHEWDGIQELNTPLPRWWLWTFYVCILFAVVYWVLYPAWPMVTGFSHGVLGFSSRGQVALDLEAIQAQRAQTEAGLDKASVQEIVADKKLLTLALAHGKAAFAEDCAPCHGSGGQGSKGYRNLTNEDWLWGGTLDAIQTTITHGIRDYADKDTRSSAMPAFGKDGILTAQQIQQVASYVRTLSKLSPEQGVRRRRRPEDLRRRLRPVPRRRRQGQRRDGLGQPHRRPAALWRGH